MNAISLGDFGWSILPVVVLVVSFFAWRLFFAWAKKRNPEQFDLLFNTGLLISLSVIIVLLSVALMVD